MVISNEERKFHRRIAVSCFNDAWDYLEKKDRSPEDDARMVSMAHASLLHWELIGTPANRAIGNWQVSRVYAAIGEGNLALSFARHCLRVCRANDLTQLMPSANEGMARAYVAAGNPREAERHLNRARSLLSTLKAESDDKKLYLGQIDETEALVEKTREGR